MQASCSLQSERASYFFDSDKKLERVFENEAEAVFCRTLQRTTTKETDLQGDLARRE
jgi:hypothetical protein